MDRPENKVTHKQVHHSRGKPFKALAITIVSLLLAIGFTALFNPPQDTEAAAGKGLLLKAWSGNGIGSGKFENWLKGSAHMKYSPELDTSNLTVEPKSGKTIHLEEKCSDDPDSPQRYWFWLKDNKLASNSLHWSTEKFIGTMEPISEPEYDTKEFKDEGDYASVERINLKSGGLLKSLGKDLGGWGLDAYCVDIKDWYDATKDLWNKDCGRVYLQTVAGIYNGDKCLNTNLDTISKWRAAARSHSFAESGIADYPSHYNQWIKVSTKEKINVEFYKVVSENDKPTEEEMECSKNNPNLLGDVKKQKLRPYSTIELSDIKTTKVGSSKYYLQGIRVQFLNTKNNKWKDIEKFFILDKEAIQTQGKTSKYSKKNGAGLAEDTLSGIEIAAINEYFLKYKDTALSKTDTTFNTGSEPAFIIENDKPLSGTQKYDKLVKHLSNLTLKTTYKDARICLVYQEVEKGAVEVQREFYDWNESDNKYKEEKDPKPKKFRVGTVKSSKNSGDFVMNGTEIERQKKDSNGKYQTTGEVTKAYDFIEESDKLGWKQEHCPAKLDHYIKEIKVQYYKPDAEDTTTKKFLLSDELGDDKDIWTGKDADRTKFEQAIEKLMKKVNIKNVDYTRKILIKLCYYQPKTPTVLSYWVNYVDEGGRSQYQLLKVFNKGEDGGREKIVNINRGTDNVPGEFTGFDKEIMVGADASGKYQIDGPNASSVKLERVEVKQSEVKGFHGAEKDKWTETIYDTGADLPNNWKKDQTEVKFNTNATGCLVAVIYKVKQPTLTVNLYRAVIEGDPHENSNLDQPVSIEKSKEECGFGKPCYVPIDNQLINTSKVHTEEIKDFLTLDKWGYNAKDAKDYRLIVTFTDADDEGGCIKEGPPADTNTLAGDYYKTKIQWEALSQDSVVLNLYYVKIDGEVLTSQYKINVFYGEAETSNPANNPSNSCSVAKNEISFTLAKTIEGSIDNTVKDVEGKVYAEKSLDKMKTPVHLMMDGKALSVEGLSNITGITMSEYGFIPDFTSVSNEKHVTGPAQSGGSYTYTLKWEKKKQEVITISLYYVKQVKANPEFIVTIYTGTKKCGKEPPENPPAQSSIAWNQVSVIKYPLSGGSASHSVAGSWPIGARTGKYVKEFTHYSDGVSGGPDNYTATASGEKNRYLYLYYFAWIPTEETVSPSDEPTILTWNDLDKIGGPGSEEDPRNVNDNSEISIISGIQPDQIVSVGSFNSGAELGGEEDIIMPDGIMQWPSSKYLPNKLKTAIECTSYLSAGKITKHVSTLRFYMTGTCSVSFQHTHSAKDCTTCHKSGEHDHSVPSTGPHGEPTTTTVGHGCDNSPHGWSGTVSDLTVSDTRRFSIELKVVWFELNELYIWQPEEGRVYSYSFPNSTSGDPSSLDSDEDTRTWSDNKFKAKDYFVKMMRKQGLNVWKSPERSDNFAGPGQASTGNAACEFFKPWLYEDPTQGLTGQSFSRSETKSPSNSDGNPYSSCGSAKSAHRSPHVTEGDINSIPGILNRLFKEGIEAQINTLIKRNSNIESDQLFFYHPVWEDCKDELKTSMTKLVYHDMFGTEAKATLSPTPGWVDNWQATSSYADLNKENTNLFGYGVEDVRIPQANMSTDKTPFGGLFEARQIRVDQSKLNTKDGLLGPKDDSKAFVRYDPIVTVGGSRSPAYIYKDKMNKVTLHTPIAIGTEISSYKPDAIQTATILSSVEKTITLGTPFKIKLDYTGSFPAYGTIDTSPYTDEYDKADFIFDYPVFVNSGGVSYHEAGDLFTVHGVSNAIFYPAYWATEGRKLIQTEVNAFNIQGYGDKMSIIHPRYDRENRMEFLANQVKDNYRAYCLLNHYNAGILTDLRITDVADYPELQPIFRKGDSYKKSGFAIHSGLTNFQGFKNFDPIVNNGSTTTQTFPVVDGDSLAYKKYNTFKTGYTIRFNLTTIATLFSQNDSIQIEPAFYWIPKAPVFGSSPVPVTVFYDENINGTTQKLVEVGSDLDKRNTHQLSIGDKEHDVLARDLIDTANRNGYNQPKDLVQKIADAWTYGDVTIPGNMKVSEGIKNKELLSYSYDGKPLGLGTVDQTTLNNCLQNWYGEYYLPNTIHVRKNDAASVAAFESQGGTGYDFKEDYWCNSGYLLINFNVYSMKDGQKHLLYNAKSTSPEYCDMWQTENRVASKTDSWLQPFSFKEGDFILYKLGADGSMSSDYKSGGTH